MAQRHDLPAPRHQAQVESGKGFALFVHCMTLWPWLGYAWSKSHAFWCLCGVHADAPFTQLAFMLPSDRANMGVCLAGQT